MLFFTPVYSSVHLILILVGSTPASFLLLKTVCQLKEASLTSRMKCIYCKKNHLWFKGTAKQLLRKLRCSTVARACSEIQNSSVPYRLPVVDLTFVCIASLDWQITQYFPLTFLLAGLISREITDFSWAGDNARKQTASAINKIIDKLWLVPSCLNHWWRAGWPDRTKLEKSSVLPSSSQAVVSD